MHHLQGFDPLLFLGITDLKDEEKDIVSRKILDRISQYLAIRIIELLPENDVKDIDDPEKLFSVAKDKVPDFNDKVKKFMGDFKKEFNNNLQQL